MPNQDPDRLRELTRRSVRLYEHLRRLMRPAVEPLSVDSDLELAPMISDERKSGIGVVSAEYRAVEAERRSLLQGKWGL